MYRLEVICTNLRWTFAYHHLTLPHIISTWWYFWQPIARLYEQGADAVRNGHNTFGGGYDGRGVGHVADGQVVIYSFFRLDAPELFFSAVPWYYWIA